MESISVWRTGIAMALDEENKQEADALKRK